MKPTTNETRLVQRNFQTWENAEDAITFFLTARGLIAVTPFQMVLLMKEEPKGECWRFRNGENRIFEVRLGRHPSIRDAGRQAKG